LETGQVEQNLHEETVHGFGRQWQSFDQRRVDDREQEEIFAQYFSVFPWERLPPQPRGFDAGCGSGRWARLVAPRVAELHCVDASAGALDVAARNLADLPNCRLHHTSLDALPLPDASMDFGYSLGVLHHLPDPAAGLAACVGKLKPGAPFLVYVYYACENRPTWFRVLWRTSDVFRRVLSRAPHRVKLAVTGTIAALVYLPLARLAAVAERRGHRVDSFPLAYYRGRSLYTMRTDALDRFGTLLEHRFSAGELERMMRAAGLVEIRFSPAPPYWCAVGFKA
jgi:SAM-dependent methyltransferase